MSTFMLPAIRPASNLPSIYFGKWPDGPDTVVAKNVPSDIAASDSFQAFKSRVEQRVDSVFAAFPEPVKQEMMKNGLEVVVTDLPFNGLDSIYDQYSLPGYRTKFDPVAENEKAAKKAQSLGLEVPEPPIRLLAEPLMNTSKGAYCLPGKKRIIVSQYKSDSVPDYAQSGLKRVIARMMGQRAYKDIDLTPILSATRSSWTLTLTSPNSLENVLRHELGHFWDLVVGPQKNKGKPFSQTRSYKKALQQDEDAIAKSPLGGFLKGYLDIIPKRSQGLKTYIKQTESFAELFAGLHGGSYTKVLPTQVPNLAKAVIETSGASSQFYREALLPKQQLPTDLFGGLSQTKVDMSAYGRRGFKPAE